jgi:hypothetical protein
MWLRRTRDLVFTLTLLTQLAGMAGGEEAPPTASGPPRVGQVAADFTLPDLDGAQHHLAQRRDTGPVVLVFFRGAW